MDALMIMVMRQLLHSIAHQDYVVFVGTEKCRKKNRIKNVKGKIDMNDIVYEGYRTCEVNGRKAIFHRWIDIDSYLLKLDMVMKPDHIKKLVDKFEETHIVPAGTHTEKIHEVVGLVEYKDGSMDKVEPKTIIFNDDYFKDYFEEDDNGNRCGF